MLFYCVCGIALCALGEHLGDEWCFYGVGNVFFIYNIVSENAVSARCVAFEPTFSQSAIYLLGEFFREVLVEPFR